MRAWFVALHIRQRYIVALLQRVAEAEERIHRLEIAQQQWIERLAVLESSQERLWAKWKGGRGGRPPKEPENPLADIPYGDKNALRAHLIPVATPRTR